MKRFALTMFFTFGILSTFPYLQAQASPLILTQDLQPGDFSTQVVDLQNFLYSDPDTRVAPIEVGRLGTQTINGLARFQNKYQQTILLPFNRLATGSAEVMTRFKIAVIGIKADPQSLKDSGVRSEFKILLSQTINKLDEEISKRNNPNLQSDVTVQDGMLYFRGRTVPNDVAVGKPGRYEVSDTEGFFVDTAGNQYHYELPATTLQPIDNPKTFDDLYQNYDYLQGLQGEIIYTLLEPGAEPQTVIAGDGGVSLKKKVSSNNQSSTGVSQSLFNPTTGVVTATPATVQNSSVNGTSLIPLVLSSERYSHSVSTNTQVHVFGRNFAPGIQGLIYQGSQTYQVPVTITSDSEMHMTLPKNLKTGRAVVSIVGQPHSAIEIFVYQEDCSTDKCTEVRIQKTRPDWNEIIFDEEVTLTGEGFSRYNNTIETAVGIYHGIESRNGTTLTFTPQYPFTVGLDGGTTGSTLPIIMRVLNNNGLSNTYEAEASLDVMVSFRAQTKRGDTEDGEQAKNDLIIEYFTEYGQQVEFINHEGLVTAVRSALSTIGYQQVKNNSGNSVVLGESAGKEEPSFFAFFNDIFSTQENEQESFLERIGFVKKAKASTFPYGGRITASYPCTCSANWVTVVLDPRGFTHSLVVQPGYTRIFAHFNIYTPGVGVVGSFTPTTGTCWMYVGVGCSPIPTTGVMDLFPGTGTTPI